MFNVGRPITNNGVCKLCGATALKQGNGYRSVCQSCKNMMYRLSVKLIKTHQCEKCEWRGYCDTHHKDGNHSNDDLDNLESLCPNCHRNYHSPLPDFWR